MRSKVKKAPKLIFFIALALSFFGVHGQELKVMTYNIKYDSTNDTVNNWNDRKSDLVTLLDHYSPGIIGMQEVLEGQLSYLVEHRPNFTAIGVGREDGKKKGEYSPILYDARLFKLVNHGTFWLSETPNIVSVGWDAALERICTYGRFEDLKTQKQFWVFNTHFDHIGVLAREKSAVLIVSKIRELNTEKLPVVLMGDFNLTPNETPIHYLMKALTDAQTITSNPFYGPTGTFSGFDPDRILSERIDYIFVEKLKVQSYIHIDDRMENNKYISDHLPVFARVILN